MRNSFHIKRVNQLFKGLCAFLYEVKIEEYEREQEFGEIKDFFTIGADGKGWLPLTTAGNEIIRSIQVGVSGPEILIGRKEGRYRWD
ncbi:hypothetical protein FACS189432_01960 [Bacteroidia bacterium]|nr:hypothetical protein FACS189432_01960 [Bacteroidia bacterium]GHV71841.1 hypothetical protein FACS189420_8150 [Bacteroidia bacterium]